MSLPCGKMGGPGAVGAAPALANTRSEGVDMTKRICSEPDCALFVFGRGWCSKHYTRFRRYGDPNKVIAPTERNVARDRVSKLCPNCGMTFEIKKSHAPKRTFCSQECRKENGRRTLTLTTNCQTCGQLITRYISQQLRPQHPVRWCSRQCKIDGVAITRVCDACHEPYTLPKHLMDIRRGCSLKCAGQLRWENSPSTWGMFKAKLESGYRTDIEAMAETVLIELGVRYEFEKRVGRFWIDFTLPDLGIGLECDGWRHEAKVEKDADRDRTLLERGWRIVRIPDAALRTDARAAILTAIPQLLSGEAYVAPYEQLRLLG